MESNTIFQHFVKEALKSASVSLGNNVMKLPYFLLYHWTGRKVNDRNMARNMDEFHFATAYFV